ncbi:glutathione S-transferase [Pseudomassariella vexata]|uniref:Glutathione S-transferase n=1 Tax=Pseudomassariella vexata TaxID=1141098 RepID=A0A1Y2EA58_9PEZI|nr:glutathione S-transferase [Pseudomassariella vexata]ORY68453.1 glutathione S-transferase [Pseudomassariella vexata]
MSSGIKPIKVYGQGGPNPPKVAIVLKELGVPFEVVPISFADVKSPGYLAINPNGRMPSIQDPNTDITLWESGAIVEYLIERYDTAYKLSFAPGTPESYHAKQWLFFQTTGQGPYYGQAVWFKVYHPETVPSAVERYAKEILTHTRVNRVTGVVEGHLAKEKEKAGGKGDGPWLVGNKMSYADISWVSWQVIIAKVLLSKDEYDVENYPHVKEWLEKMASRESVVAALAAAEPKETN